MAIVDAVNLFVHNSYTLPASRNLFGAFQTGADIFADGFETGDLGSWSVIQ